MHWRGFRNLCFFYFCWLGGSFLIPLSLFALIFGSTFPLLIVIAYYSLRFFIPAKKSEFVRQCFMSDDTPYCRSSNIIFDEGASPPKPFSKVLLSVAPHGILTLGWSYCISSRPFYDSEVKWLVAPAMMRLPFVSDVMHWTGCSSCAPQSMRDILSTGCNVGLIPGGFQEATMFKHGKHRLFLKSKKGFVKYALQYGYSILPIYAFGEELTFWTVDLLPKSIALWLNSFQIPTYCFIGKYFFMPNDDMDFNVVVGKPIALPQIANPSPEEVSKYHAIYLEKYQELFNKFKGKYAAQGHEAELEIF